MPNDAPDDPLPPEEIGSASGLTPQQALEVRKRNLLKRFLISARGFWSPRGNGRAWSFSIGRLAMIGGMRQRFTFSLPYFRRWFLEASLL